MKKITKILLGMMLVLAMTGCGKSKENTVFSADDLKGKTIGVQLGTIGDIYASDEKDSKVERYNKGADAVQALISGKIDTVIIDEQPAKAFVEENKGKIKIIEEEYALEEYAICVAKNNSKLTEDMNKAIKELKEDGTLDSIIKNYIGDDTKGKTPYESPKDVDRSKGTLTMATNAAFKPYEFHDGDEIVGIDADLARAICDKLGYDLKIEDMEFDSVIVAVSSGKADFGASGLTVTEERKKNIDFTDSYTTTKQVLIVRE